MSQDVFDLEYVLRLVKIEAEAEKVVAGCDGKEGIKPDAAAEDKHEVQIMAGNVKDEVRADGVV